MAFDFPSSPTPGQVFSAYTWDGEKWVLGSATIVGSDGLLPRRSQGLTPHEKLNQYFLSVSTITSAADALTLFDSNGASKRFAPYSATLNIATSGVNGLDTGSEAASTWYHIWAIGKADGTVSGLLSASLTAPTLPSGYTYKGLIGAVYNDASSNFIVFVQNGNSVSQFERIALNAGKATAHTPVSLAAFVPPNAREAVLGAAAFSSGGILTNGITGVVAAAGSGVTPVYGSYRFGGTAQVADGGGIYGSIGALLMSTPQQVSYYVYDSSVGFGGLYIYVNGWVF